MLSSNGIVVDVDQVLANFDSTTITRGLHYQREGRVGAIAWRDDGLALTGRCSGSGNNVYVVVPTNKITGFTADAALKSLFAGPTAAICATGTGSPQATAVKFGFDTLAASEGTCGATTLTGNS